MSKNKQSWLVWETKMCSNLGVTKSCQQGELGVTKSKWIKTWNLDESEKWRCCNLGVTKSCQQAELGVTKFRWVKTNNLDEFEKRKCDPI